MKFKTSNFLSIIFSPISYLWETIYRIRRFFYDVGYIKRNTYKVPIISVGNLTLGGTGKTPFTIWLSNFLNDQHRNVMILTRGYKGALENNSGIIKPDSKVNENPFEFGDEALVLSRGLRKGSVIVGKKRSENLNFYFSKEHPDVVLLDDGHQHLKIARDINIVLFDSLLPISRYKAPPLGYLREGMTALKDADLIVFGRADLVGEEQLSKLENFVSKYAPKNTPVATFRYIPNDIKSSKHQHALGLDDLKGKNVVCMSGIASPESFHELVKNLGANIVKAYQFPDHHYYSEEDIVEPNQIAKENDAIIITTEKDIVKLRRVFEHEELYYIDIKVDFLSGRSEVENLVSRVLL